MSVTFTPEDGTGLAGANSFTTTDVAWDYHQMHLHAEAWTNASPTVQETALMRATLLICTVFAGRWKGVTLNDTQALPFPRQGLYDTEGRAISTDAVPIGVQYATAELARREIEEDQAALLDGGAVRMKQVGDLQLEYAIPTKQVAIRDAVLMYLRPYLRENVVIRA
jgi:hypothetical protein